VSGGADVGAGVGAGVGSVAGSLVEAWVVSALDSLEPVASLAHAAIAPKAIDNARIRRTLARVALAIVPGRAAHATSTAVRRALQIGMVFGT
jgi:hypothetical protein